MRSAVLGAVLGAVLVVVGLISTGCGPSTAGGDEVIGSPSENIFGTSATVLLPTGEVTVTIGDPVKDVAARDTRDLEARQAPDGSSLLPVQFDYDLSAAPWGGLLAAAPKEAPVTLVVDGERRSLGSPYSTDGRAIGANSRAFYVVVPGSPAAADVTLEVAYDGATQTVGFTGADPTGEASSLSMLSAERPPAANCPSKAWRSRPQANVKVICDVPLAARTPYWPGSGWSTTDEGWLVAQVRRLQVYPNSTPVDDRYEIEQVTGSGAASGLDGGDSNGPLSGVVVFEDKGSSVPLRLDVLATPPGGTDPIRLRLRYDVAATDS